MTKFEKSGFTPMIIKRKLRVLTFELWNPNLITKNVVNMNGHAKWLSWYSTLPLMVKTCKKIKNKKAISQ